MDNKKIIEALEKIKRIAEGIDTQNYNSESKKNQLIGYCEGLIEGLQEL